MLLANCEPLGKILAKDTIIWRSVGHRFGNQITHSCFPKPIKPVQVDNQYMLRVSLARGFTWEPEATDSDKGIVVFLNHDLPDDWVYLTITGTSKAISDGPSGGSSRKSGGAIFAELGKAQIDMKQYLEYRSMYSEMVEEYPNLSNTEERQ